MMQQNIKDTKFESKSQPQKYGGNARNRCNRISKIQNLKANHNDSGADGTCDWMQQNIKDTKFESKSQRLTTAAPTK